MTAAARKTKLKAVPSPAIAEEKEQMKIVIVGHVDHGKSTLIGRLFHDTDSLEEGKYEKIKAMCEKRGMPFEWSFLMDALQAERDQGITIDTTQIWFKTEKRDYVIIDAPGHKEFLKNMISGAASSEAALLVIDAREGVQEQSRRHGYLLHLLGVRQIAVMVNKMDAVGYDEKTFRHIEKEYTAYLASIGVTPKYIIPISAREGDNIIANSRNMAWYKGPSIIGALDSFELAKPRTDLALRFPVQDVYKFDDRRIIAGRIESGTLRVGDKLLFSPRNRVAHVKSIETWNTDTQPSVAVAGQSVGITLDEQLFIERGHIASHVDEAPVLTNIFKARIIWLGDEPLEIGTHYKFKINTSEYFGEITAIEQVINTQDLSHAQAMTVNRNDVAEVAIRIKGQIAVDDFNDNAICGRFVIVDKYQTVGGGIISLENIKDQRVKVREVKATNLTPVDFDMDHQRRAEMNGHTGGILWLTGLSGAGKSTIAKALAQRLFDKGYQTYVLDGDNIRRGLNSDLGFSPKERSENIRRVGEVAALFADAGVIVISAFISPYQSDRMLARNAAPKAFHTVYIKAGVDTCEKRDVKGLYAKARKGEIKDFTGISAPYEEPENPELVVDTEKLNLNQCVALLEQYVTEQFVDPVFDASMDKSIR